MGDSVAVDDLYVRPLEWRAQIVLGRGLFGRGHEDDPARVLGLVTI